MVTTFVQILEANEKDAVAKDAKVAVEALQTEKHFRFCMFLSEASLKAERSCVVSVNGRRMLRGLSREIGGYQALSIR